MKPTLQVRLSQHLALTPQLQQSIRLLQLSTLELHQEVEQMLERNPFLEPDADADAAESGDAWSNQRVAASDGPRGEEVERTQQHLAEREESSDEPAGLQAADFGTPGNEEWSNGTEGDDFDGIREAPTLRNGATGDGEGFDDDFGGASGGGPSLADHLREQVRGMRLADEDAAAVLALVDSLDDDGYLADPLEEIEARLAAQMGLDDAPIDAEARADLRETLHARLRCALRWLQSLEPTGVGAANLAECIDLQLRERPAGVVRTLARTIVADHLELLARRDSRRLMSLTGASEALLREAQAMIVACEPKPGRPFSRAESNIIVPDVLVQRSGHGWRVVLNPAVMPKLRINDLYARAIRGSGRSGEGGGLSGQLQEARWFVKNVLQRFDTIQRVSQAIVERQSAFFTHGALAMKPLVLREIADELSLHESTISRVTTAKYMATPHGTFELKYFFGSGLATEAGGNASSTAVRELIKQFVAAESCGKPLSDSKLADMLAEQGIQVARRTVAKYREGLKIAPASQRRAL